MKIKEGYVLREVANTWVVLPLGAETINFSGMLTLNGSGALLWKVLEKGSSKEELTAALVAEYEVSEEKALADVEKFLNKLIQTGCVEE